MTQFIEISVPGRGLHEITDRVRGLVGASGVDHGVCVLFMRHTSASLTIQENADPTARRDLERWLDRTVLDDDPSWTHTAEGPDDMPSHVRSMLTDVSLSIPIAAGELTLGTWQGIYVCEHRASPRTRSLAVAIVQAG